MKIIYLLAYLLCFSLRISIEIAQFLIFIKRAKNPLSPKKIRNNLKRFFIENGAFILKILFILKIDIFDPETMNPEVVMTILLRKCAFLKWRLWCFGIPE